MRRRPYRQPIIAVVVALFVLVPAFLALAAPAHWSVRVVDQLRVRGLLVSDAAPGETIDRSEVSRMLVGALGLTQDARDLRFQPSRFYDVPVGEPAAFVEISAEVGVMRGYGGGWFGPSDPLTRAQLVTVLVRAMGWEGRALALADKPLPFSDNEEIPAWATGYVAIATHENLVRGFDDGSFRPNAPVARGEASALIARFMEGRGSLVQRQGTLTEAVGARGQVRIGAEWLALTEDASVYRNGQRVAADTLRKGESVRAILDEVGRVRYLEVQVPAISGELKEVDAKTRRLRLEGNLGRAVDVALTESARLFRNGQPVGLERLQTGDQVFALLDGTGAVVSLDATRTGYSGVLVDIQLGSRPRLVAVGETGFLEAPLSLNTVVYLNEKKAALSDLRPSDRLDIALDEGGTVVYLEVRR